MCGYTAFFTPVKCPMKLTLNFELQSLVYVTAHPLHMGTALVKIERDCRKTKYTLDKEYVLILTFELQSLVKVTAYPLPMGFALVKTELHWVYGKKNFLYTNVSWTDRWMDRHILISIGFVDCNKHPISSVS